MVEINLLPWRLHLRAYQRRKWRLIIVVTFLLMGLLWWLWSFLCKAREPAFISLPAKPFSKPTAPGPLPKIVGYLRRGHNQRAVIALPTKILTTVGVNDFIGRDKVIAIAPDHLVLLTPAKQTIVLK